MANVLNLASKGKNFKNRTLKIDTREHKFVVSQPTHLRSTYTRLADRYNEPQADQATIPVYDQTPPLKPTNFTLDFVNEDVVADCDDTTDASGTYVSGLRGYRWFLDGVFKQETTVSQYTFPSTEIGHVYTVGLSVIDNDGNETTKEEKQIDVTRPNDVSNLQTTPSDNTITATVDPQPDAYFFNWYLDGTLIGTTDTANANSESFDFTDLTNGQQYEVGVEVVGQYGIKSVNIITALETPEDLTPPDAPTNLTVDAIFSDSADISWTPSSASDLAGYDVYYKESSVGSYTKHNNTLITATSYTVDNLQSETTYDIYVIAVDDDGLESVQSNTVQLTPESLAQNSNSLSFEGNSYIETDQNNMFGENEVSIFFYCTIDQLLTSGDGQHRTVFGSFNGTDGERFYVSHSWQNDADYWSLGIGSNFITEDTATVEEDLNNLIFGCLTVDKNTNSAKLFINGEEKCSGIFSGDLQEDQPFVIGARNQQDDGGAIDAEGFEGQIDELFVLNKSVTLEEYNSYYWKLKKALTDPNLIHYWKLDTLSPTDYVTENNVVNAVNINLDDPLLKVEEFPPLLYEGEFSFTSMNIPSSQTTTLKGKCILNIKETVSIEGVINGNVNGYKGGKSSSFEDGQGPGAGKGQTSDGGTGGGYGGYGGTAPDAESFDAKGIPYGSEAGDDIFKGSGGSSGDDIDTENNIGFGGNGGAALKIISQQSVLITGEISVNGQKGGKFGSLGRSGGGGSGGGVLIKGPSIDFSGVISASGGDGGEGDSTNSGTDEGGGGAGGRVKLLSPSIVNNGTIDVSGGVSTKFSDDPAEDGEDGTSYIGEEVQEYETNFSEYTVGQSPNDWMLLQGDDFSVENQESAEGGKVLQQNTSNTSVLEWSGQTAFSDIELLTKFRTNDVSSSSRIWLMFSQGSGNYYYSSLREGNTLEIAEQYRGSYSQQNSISFNYNTNTWYYIKMLKEGNNISVKVWEASSNEPSSWTLQALSISPMRLLTGKLSVGKRSGLVEFDTVKATLL